MHAPIVETLHDFYVNTLGLTPAYPCEKGQDWFAATAGTTTLYFFQGTGEHLPKASRDIGANRPGIESLAFLVADLDEAVAALDGKVEWSRRIPEVDSPERVMVLLPSSL